MEIYVLYDRCKELLAPPFNFSGNNSMDEEKLYEALSPMYDCLQGDDSLDGFVKWVMVPLVVVFGVGALSEVGRQKIQGKEAKITYLSNVYKAEKGTYLAQKNSSDLGDEWDFVRFASRDFTDIGKAFLNAFKYKRIKL